jgi:hypothetical protein
MSESSDREDRLARSLKRLDHPQANGGYGVANENGKVLASSRLARPPSLIFFGFAFHPT